MSGAPSIRDMFFEECEELLEALVEGLAGLEASGPDAAESLDTVNAVFRAVHSIKGGAGAFGLDALVDFAHTFETVLDKVRSGSLTADADLMRLFHRSGDQLANLVEAARDEARAVYAAHGIAFADVSMKDPRRAEHLRITDIEGVERVGGSTTQSLLRGLGSIETDYLNGEIVLLGRLAGVPTPVNAGLVALAARLVQEGAPAGGVDAAQLRADLGLA